MNTEEINKMSTLTMERDERPQIGGWAPGNYEQKCFTCNKAFTGHKRANTCAPCAYAEEGKPKMLKKEADDLRLSIAMKIIKQAMIEDDPSKGGSLAHAWHCNIAMACYDAIRSYDDQVDFAHDFAHEVGNDAASRFMKILFGVETKA